VPSADHVAAALREHLPHAAGPRLHRLMYYVQGHHLALFGQPAFDDAIYAGNSGPGMPDLADNPPAPYRPGSVGDSVHAVAIMVAARYGGLTTTDLNQLTRAEPPWRGTPPGAVIAHELLREYFAGPGRQDPAAHSLLAPNPERTARVREEVARLHRGEATRRPDDLDKLVGEVRGRARR
jgi:uncharacterized phage-associated protein